VTRDATGLVTVDDPDSPLLLRVRVAAETGRISEVQVSCRHPSGRITAAALSRLPLDQIRAVASPHPNDWLMRLVLTPRVRGSRSWPQRHWDEVAEVAAWARETRRPGGAARAVADMWGVAVDPTAYRWLARVRGSRPHPPK
jgi:hypothetical protein